ncbi:MAG: type II toxin-antitoxin system VapC family toxin [Thermomicrobiales bacterium]|nr:type II toxin-antitoxin system VapC family toxin [Thermomicrobiales bacterium]
MPYYVDSSALAKLVIQEAESSAFHAWLSDNSGEWVSSHLTRTEMLRTIGRTRPELMPVAHVALASAPLLALPRDVFDRAGILEPAYLRSLDALHLAVALGLGNGLLGIVTYDRRMAEAALLHGVRVVAPA